MAASIKYNKLHLPSRRKNIASPNNLDYNSLLLNKVSSMIRCADENSKRKIDNYKEMYDQSQVNQSNFTSKMKTHVEKFKSQHNLLNERYCKTQEDNKALQELIKSKEMENKKLKSEYTKASEDNSLMSTTIKKIKDEQNKKKTNIVLNKKRKMMEDSNDEEEDKNLPFF